LRIGWGGLEPSFVLSRHVAPRTTRAPFVGEPQRRAGCQRPRGARGEPRHARARSTAPGVRRGAQTRTHATQRRPLRGPRERRSGSLGKCVRPRDPDPRHPASCTGDRTPRWPRFASGVRGRNTPNPSGARVVPCVTRPVRRGRWGDPQGPALRRTDDGAPRRQRIGISFGHGQGISRSEAPNDHRFTRPPGRHPL